MDASRDGADDCENRHQNGDYEQKSLIHTNSEALHRERDPVQIIAAAASKVAAMMDRCDIGGVAARKVRESSGFCRDTDIEKGLKISSRATLARRNCSAAIASILYA